MSYIDAILAKGATMPRIFQRSTFQRSTFQRRTFLRLLCFAAVLGAAFGMRAAAAATPEAYDPWPGLVQDIFNNRPMNDGSDVIGIKMPYRAEDAAIVPVILHNKLAPTDDRRVLSITLVIDQNPAPMAAKFELGQDARVS
jgi:sulfur-oxidizing protein SoxY